jgi:hypothetical protein
MLLRNIRHQNRWYAPCHAFYCFSNSHRKMNHRRNIISLDRFFLHLTSSPHKCHHFQIATIKNNYLHKDQGVVTRRTPCLIQEQLWIDLVLATAFGSPHFLFPALCRTVSPPLNLANFTPNFSSSPPQPKNCFFLNKLLFLLFILYKKIEFWLHFFDILLDSNHWYWRLNIDKQMFFYFHL